ncbi:pentatricopeptide repeat-containing protein At3g51320-like [Telopea speciosissima]|uniref:pentatricopeptide repeat-containing protein At3g51320-like n=1 Tax=Telopea speciosissima TaxID=54955 RepID=UPI001CC5CAB3|nr:pentatricopeptide repeat-containing protein At3g51320-like [Telopea speciosissima]
MARASNIRDIIRSRFPIFTSNPTLCSLYSSFSSSSSASSSFSALNGSLQPLQTCHNMRQLYQIQAYLITSGLFQDPFAASRVLKFSADSGDIDHTILIFRHIDLPDTFCFNTVIKAYSCGPVPYQAVIFYFEMIRNGFFPNSFTFPPLLSACAKSQSSELGEKCHGQIVKNGVDSVVPVQNSLIHMYSCCGSIESAKQLFDEMPQRDLVSWNSIVDGYAKLGDLGTAQILFGVMPERNVVSWNIMITGYLDCGKPGNCLKLFREMMKIGLRGSDTTMVSVLTACGRSARLKEGKSVHGSLIRNLFRLSLILGTALIDMYCKSQKVEYAQRLFDGMSERNLVCWNAMILGHCINGCPQDGLNLFVDMVGRLDLEDEPSECIKTKNSWTEGHRVLPDEVTFVGILCACTRAGLLSVGRNLFYKMINVYRIKPKFAHYWCMAHLYFSVGLIHEAEEILCTIPMEDNGEDSLNSLLLSGLLGLCRFQGDVEVGERIANRLIELEPHNPSRYALLLNVYAAASQWEDVAKVKELATQRGLKRIPGCSLRDLNEIVHKFKVGDKLQPGMAEVCSMMDEMVQQLRTSSTGFLTQL